MLRLGDWWSKPDMVGESEYRALRDLAESIVESCETTGEAAAMLRAAGENLQAWIDAMIVQYDARLVKEMDSASTR